MNKGNSYELVSVVFFDFLCCIIYSCPLGGSKRKLIARGV